MSSISSSTNVGSTGSTSSIRGYGGLASGLDRDTLIESMTYATRAKIAKQQQKKQTYTWKQEAYRSVSDKLVQFSRKYTSYTSSTNLSSSSFWARSSITALGANSSKISVSGSSSIVDSLSIVGVKQLAKDASLISNAAVSDRKLSTGELNLVDKEKVSNLEGQFLTLKYGKTTVNLSFSSGSTADGFTYDYSTADKAKESITACLKNASIGNGKTLADVISVEATQDGDSFSLNFKSTDKGGNTIQVAGGSQTALDAMGISKGVIITDKGFSTKSDQNFFSEKTFAERVAGKSISFTYNGTTKSIKFDDDLADKLEGKTNAEALDILKEDMQKKLNKQFGEGRIEVGTDASTLTFKTTVPGGGEDKSSILSISSSDKGLLGKTGALKTAYGESNRINLTATLAESGLDGISAALQSKGKDNLDTTYFAGASKALEIIDSLGDKVTDTMTAEELKTLIADSKLNLTDKELSNINEAIDQLAGSASGKTAISQALNDYVDPRELKLTVNDVEIKGLSYNSTINDIINKINSSDAGVTASYMKNADKFSIVSTAGGASGRVELGGADAEMIFGASDSYTVSEGKDAIVGVKYKGSDDVVELVRGNNAFNLDGLNITLNGTFGYKDDGSVDESAEAITFNAKVDADKITTAVSDMVKDLNEIIALVNDEVSTKPDRNYSPLTDEQKEEMTDEQIEKWETKAKAGILFGDSDLRGLADSLRFIMDSGSEEKSMLESFGISTSSSYGDNGKLVFDETKFRAALESNPEDLKTLFTKTADDSTGTKGGLMARLTSITDKYASTTGATKGILIERAGSTYAPTSILSNYLQKSIDNIDSYIERLQDQLETEQDRYISQFTSLETLISQMNSQSSWLSSAFS